MGSLSQHRCVTKEPSLCYNKRTVPLLHGVIKGILLHQGETDAYGREWQETVRKIYCDLQQELQFDPTAVPLLVGEVVRSEYGGICGHANHDIANRYPNTYVVSSEGCLPCEDNLHFSGEGYRLLGRHYAQRYLEVTKNLRIAWRFGDCLSLFYIS